jgi:hypothetical protein
MKSTFLLAQPLLTTLPFSSFSSREVAGHPSLNGEILKELYEKSTAEEAPDAAEVSDDNE